jgi:hypothetical protein
VRARVLTEEGEDGGDPEDALDEDAEVSEELALPGRGWQQVLHI